jgi:MoaA/NifB/PqqE/SkfB family radical SAM enzyme
MLAGYTVPRLLRHFHEIGAGKINIVPVTVPPNDELDVFFSDVFADMVRDYQEAVRLTFAAKRAGVVVRFGMVEETLTLLRKDKLESKHYCQAGVSTLTVGANGDVYPCFMFINKEGFHLGHVDGDHQLAAFARDPKHGVDFGCPGRQFMMNGKITPFRPDEILKNAVVDTVLDCLNELLDDLEVTYGLRASDASSSSAVQPTASAKSLAPA